MFKKITIPTTWKKCEFQTATLLAIGSGIGAACGYGSLNFLYALAALPLLVLLNRRQLCYALSGAIICLTSGIIQKQIAETSQRQTPVIRGRISGEVTCLDTRTSNVIPLLQTQLNCRIESDGRKFDAKVRFPEGILPFYGDKYKFSGKIFPPEPLGLICRSNEISGELASPYSNKPVINIEQAEAAETDFHPLRPLLKCREVLLRSLIAGINDSAVAAMSAQLFLGANKNIPLEQRNNFINTGTIHLFSVSGLHVMLTAGMILLLLRPVPFRWRYLLTAGFTLIYVLLTGASLPAVRAGVMVIIWCVMRSMLIYSSSWQALMWTWSAFMAITPESCSTLSAQYSFGVTAALILAGTRCREFFKKQQDIAKLMPAKQKLTIAYLRKLHFRRKISTGAVIIFTAFAASTGLTLYWQNIFTPGSIPANILLTIFTPLLFGAFSIKMAVSWIAVLERWSAIAMQTLFYGLTDCTAGISGIFGAQSTPDIPQWSVMIYYVCFFGVLGLKNPRNRKLCAMGASVIFFCWQLPTAAEKGTILVVNSDSSAPALIAFSRPQGDAVIVDTPDRETAKAACRVLKQHGVNRANVIFSTGTVRSCDGIGSVNYSLDTTVFLSGWKRKPTAAFHKKLQKSAVPVSDVPYHGTSVENTSPGVKIRFAPGVEVTSRSSGNGREITVCTDDGKIYRQTLPWCSQPVIWECRLK